MKPASVLMSFTVLLFVVLLNHVDNSEAIFIPIIKPDLRFIGEKKKQLLSFVNMPAIFQMLGQIINLGAVMQHFGLAPPGGGAPAMPHLAAALQRGSGSSNMATLIPPPMTDQPITECEENETTTVQAGDPESSEVSTAASSEEKTIVSDESREAQVESQEGAEELDTKASDSRELRENGNEIDVEFRRRKLESIRRAYILNAIERIRKN